MSLQPQPDSLNPRYEECLRLHHCWAWFLGLGLALMVVGLLAIGAAFVTTLATVLVFGVLLIVGGVVQVVNASLARSWGGFFLHLLAGVLQLVLGGLMVEHPLRAAEGLTLMLAAAFLVGGVLRVVHALMRQFPGWGWVLANGVIALMLGVAIWRQWPEASAWVIGLFVGIDLVFNGWSWVMLGLLVKASAPAPRPAAPPAPASAPAGVR
jgi:uncharacterized membrane protein HdeD (DUF308 family)